MQEQQRSRCQIPRDLLEHDAVLSGLAVARNHLAIPLAALAWEMVQKTVWFPFGYARLEDFARERLRRSARWLRDLAALHRMMTKVPALVRAVCGTDGKEPLGRVAALVIGRNIPESEIESWIEKARSLSVRDLQSEIKRWRSLRDTGSVASVSASSAEEDLVQICIKLPEPLRALFAEVHDLHHSVIGKESTRTSLVEALTAEGGSTHEVEVEKTLGTLLEVPGGSRSGRRDRSEVSQARSTSPPALLNSARFSSVLRTSAMTKALKTLETYGHVLRTLSGGSALVPFEGFQIPETSSLQACREDDAAAGSKSNLWKNPAALLTAFKTLLRVEDEIEQRIGELLLALHGKQAWHELGFDGIGQYVEDRLGIQRRCAQDRMQLQKLHRMRDLRQAYEEGRLGMEAALLLRRIAGRLDPETQGAWVQRASEVTIKRLRDEIRLVTRGGLRSSDALLREEQPRKALPLEDREWLQGIQRVPGHSRERVLRLGCRLIESVRINPRPADVFLHLRVPREVGVDFLMCLESVRLQLLNQAERVAFDSAGADARLRPSVRIARLLIARRAGLPLWVALLWLLEEYVCTWDEPAGFPTRAADAIYNRAGWRCTAPGCTSRQNLEDHHVAYRSRGGGHEIENRTCLCRFHHQQGEHAGLMRCRGKAPENLVWRLGKPQLGQWFRNERRLEIDEDLRQGGARNMDAELVEIAEG